MRRRKKQTCQRGAIGLQRSALAVLLWAAAVVHGMAAEPTDSLLRCLDAEIAHFSQRTREHRQHTRELQEQLATAPTDSARYALAYRLFDHYMPYSSDSAFIYISQCIDLATRDGDHLAADTCRAMLALRCSNTGQYQEALSVLGDIQPERLHGRSLGRYYQAYSHVYSELAYYSRLPQMQERYAGQGRHYAQLMLEVMPTDDDGSFLQREMDLQLRGRLDASMAVNDEWLRHVGEGSRRFALVAFYRYLEYKAREDSVETIHWLARSALADVRNAVMDQGSMWELANQLMHRGDVERSYRYIIFASDCARRYGSRQRSWTITPLLTDIATDYKKASDRSSTQLKMLLGMAVVLACLLLVSLFFVYRQRNRLAQAQADLRQSNQKLTALNEELKQSYARLSEANRRQTEANDQLSEANSRLKDMNEQLSDLNSQLRLANVRLNESNRVKEEYIGRFLSLCSTYIDKMDTLRKRVNKLAKAHSYDELAKVTRAQDFREQELDALYSHFDTAFLHLFPNFVDDFNQLLRPEERITLPDDKQLNTSIRIFALIRLGIEDSSKIAEFLHYSVNTIYNYRARVKNGALTDRENFEQRVKLLGSSQ